MNKGCTKLLSSRCYLKTQALRVTEHYTHNFTSENQESELRCTGGWGEESRGKKQIGSRSTVLKTTPERLLVVYSQVFCTERTKWVTGNVSLCSNSSTNTRGFSRSLRPNGGEDTCFHRGSTFRGKCSLNGAGFPNPESVENVQKKKK